MGSWKKNDNADQDKQLQSTNCISLFLITSLVSALVIIIIVIMNWEGVKVTGKGKLLCAESPGSGLLLKKNYTQSLNPFDVFQQSL